MTTVTQNGKSLLIYAVSEYQVNGITEFQAKPVTLLSNKMSQKVFPTVIAKVTWCSNSRKSL